MNDSALTLAAASPVESRPAVATNLLRPLLIRVRPLALALIVPVLLVLVWQVGTVLGGSRLIPPPTEVAVMMWDFAVGGIRDDSFSATLHLHLLQSVSKSMTSALVGALAGAGLVDPSVEVTQHGGARSSCASPKSPSSTLK